MDTEVDYVIERKTLIAKIVDCNNSTLTSIGDFANDVEYEVYADACERATGTGWAIHLPQDCHKRLELDTQ